MKLSSLRVRMAAVFGLLITGVAVFMIEFFPARMDEQARASARLAAFSLTETMATAVAPALEFDDADNAAKVLAWVGGTPDARFAVVVTEAGQRFATWGADRIPRALVAGMTSDMLVTRAPVVGRSGAHGTLFIGQSLDRLIADRDAARSTVVTASIVVLAIGLLACIVLATALVRPLERLTAIAHDIARGAKPPRIAGVAGSHEVVQVTSALDSMLDRLNQANHQLVEASRHAGMAEVATGVLHNVGNILTSVNIGIELIEEHVAALPVDRVRRAGELLSAARDPSGHIAPPRLDAGLAYIAAIGDHIDGERTQMRAAITTLRGHIEHVKRVISMQNGYARTGGVLEQVELAALIAEAIALGCADPQRHGIEVVTHVPPGCVTLDRHRVLQILVNLMTNARDSLSAHERGGAPGPFRVTVTAALAGGSLEIGVADTGGGIAPEALRKVFSAGFTTKPRGHGYGLHSSALTAEQLGGALTCASEGLGTGASFVLRVPVKEVTSHAS